jgi:hypothetical protein
MFDAYIIEVHSHPAGLVVRERSGFRFYASDPCFSALEHRLFGHPRDAERAARRHREAPRKHDAAAGERQFASASAI